MHADAAHVRNGGQRPRQILEARIAQRQRVPAAEDDLLERWVGGDLGERRAPARRGTALLRIRELPAKAVAAVHGARLSGDEKGAAAIFLQQGGRAQRGTLSDRVGGVLDFIGKLRRDRQNLAQQRIFGIAAAHPRDEAARYPQAKAAAGRFRTPQLLGAQAEHGSELFQAGDCLGELLLPGPRLELARLQRRRYHTRPFGSLSAPQATFPSEYRAAHSAAPAARKKWPATPPARSARVSKSCSTATRTPWSRTSSSSPARVRRSTASRCAISRPAAPSSAPSGRASRWRRRTWSIRRCSTSTRTATSGTS